MKNIASVAIALQTGLPVLMWGPPGSAKTSFAYAFSQHTGRPIEVLIGSTREPSDFSGLPIPRRNGNEVLDAMKAMTEILRAQQDDSTPVFAYTNNEDYIPDVVQAPLAWAKRLSKTPGILFLDEISCFVGSTMVRLGNGSSVPIRDVKIGDTVLSFDLEHNRLVRRRVTALIRKKQKGVVRVVTTNGSFDCTPNHEIYTERGWIAAGNLNRGDRLHLLPGLHGAASGFGIPLQDEARVELGFNAGVVPRSAGQVQEIGGQGNCKYVGNEAGEARSGRREVVGVGASNGRSVGSVSEGFDGRGERSDSTEERRYVSGSDHVGGTAGSISQGGYFGPRKASGTALQASGRGHSVQSFATRAGGSQCQVHEVVGRSGTSGVGQQEDFHRSEGRQDSTETNARSSVSLGEGDDSNRGAVFSPPCLHGGQQSEDYDTERGEGVEEPRLYTTGHEEGGLGGFLHQEGQAGGGGLLEGWLHGPSGECAGIVGRGVGGNEGNEVFGDLDWVQVLSVDDLLTPRDVFDLTVDDTHNYFANDVLVHNCAPPAVSAALLRVVLDKVVGDMPLHPDTWMLAAANPPEQAAGGWDLPMPLANRFVHINWGVDVDIWVNGMISGWPQPKIPVLPDNWEDGLPQAKAMIASYIKSRPTQLLIIPKAESDAGKAWPSPRSWTMAATMLAACKSVGAGIDTQAELIAGCVGNGVGLEFIAWLRDMDLPDPELLLKDANLIKPLLKEGRGDKIHTALTSLAAVVIQNFTTERWCAIWSVLSLVFEKTPDVATATARVISNKRPEDENAWPGELIRAVRHLVEAADVIKKRK